MTEDKGTTAILGGRGMLGTDLQTACEKNSIGFRVFDLPEFDIANDKQLGEVVEKYETIVNCAAYTNVDGAECESALAHRINAQAVGRLGELAQKGGRYVFHISTDFVFDGKLDRPYVETDRPNPINEYGRSKLAGERALVESGCRNCIMRIEWTYGRAGENFVTKLLKWARQQAKLKVVGDQVGSPTATTEVAAAICALLKDRREGLFHFAAAGYVSRFEMARFVLERLNIDADVQPCRTGDFVTPAARPLNSRFSCEKIAGLLGKPIRPWQQPLKEFLETV
jgi:dTDP-4-dehydrorhamnose reductase